MAAALKAKGYSYQYVFSEGARHTDANVILQTLPRALEAAGNPERERGAGRRCGAGYLTVIVIISDSTGVSCGMCR